MIQAIIENVFESGFQVLGWGVLKVVTFGRYRGFVEPNDMLIEGATGLLTAMGIAYALYRWL